MNNTISKGLLILFTFLTVISYGQDVSIIHENENPNKAENPNGFDYIESNYKIEDDRYIATLKGVVTNSGQSILSNLFNSFWKTANEIGGNSFRFEKIKKSYGFVLIEISVYNLTDFHYKEMVKLYPTNMVYVIGDLDISKTPKKIKFNNEKKELAPMEFIEYQNQIGGKASVGIGGFLGTKISIKGKKGDLPIHLSLGGFNVGPNRFGEVGLSFSTGKIHPVDLNFGQFLISILSEGK